LARRHRPHRVGPVCRQGCNTRTDPVALTGPLTPSGRALNWLQPAQPSRFGSGAPQPAGASGAVNAVAVGAARKRPIARWKTTETRFPRRRTRLEKLGGGGGTNGFGAKSSGIGRFHQKASKTGAVAASRINRRGLPDSLTPSFWRRFSGAGLVRGVTLVRSHRAVGQSRDRTQHRRPSRDAAAADTSEERPRRAARRRGSRAHSARRPITRIARRTPREAVASPTAAREPRPRFDTSPPPGASRRRERVGRRPYP
jgi:hypothetical protein